MIPKDLRYTKDHEWIRAEGDSGTLGITDHAQKSLGDVVFVELPAEGATFKRGETFGVVESVKAASDCFMPVSGTVLEVNAALADAPQHLNEDPYGRGWLLKVKLADPSELGTLMTDEAYAEFLEESEKEGTKE